jgi:K+-sensing histidine kinase KdpD
MTIEDNGSGLSQHEFERIFNRYYRGTNTDNQGEGSGLGLAICRDIVLAHGGAIKALQSESGGLKIEIEINQ